MAPTSSCICEANIKKRRLTPAMCTQSAAWRADAPHRALFTNRPTVSADPDERLLFTAFEPLQLYTDTSDKSKSLAVCWRLHDKTALCDGACMVKFRNELAQAWQIAQPDCVFVTVGMHAHPPRRAHEDSHRALVVARELKNITLTNT